MSSYEKAYEKAYEKKQRAVKAGDPKAIAEAKAESLEASRKLLGAKKGGSHRREVKESMTYIQSKYAG